MLKTRGIAMSDGLNRKNHYFPISTILNAYENSWNQGTPSNLNHDSTKFIGWNYVTGIYMEPGKVYVTNEMHIPENKTEHKKMFEKNLNYLYKVYYLDKKDKFGILKEQLGDKLTQNAKPAFINCIAYEDKDIVLRVFPEMKEKLHKGLIDINLLEPVLPGVYRMGNYILFAHRFFRRNCSMLNSLNDSFLERLQKLRGSNLKVQIALDLDIIGMQGTEKGELEYQYWWGPKFNEDLSSIPRGVTRHKNENYDNVFSNLCFTEFGWYIQDNRQTFECEEVTDKPNIKKENNEYYGCRFVHSMLNPETNLPNHLDGAIRAYTDEKMVERLDSKIDKSERDTWYTKLWRIDNDISVSLWKELITHYYRDNMLIGEYFSGEDEKFNRILLEDTAKDEEKPLEKYVPTNMFENDGIRFYFNYTPCVEFKDDNKLRIYSDEYIEQDNNEVNVMESDTITIIKILRSYGIKVEVPCIERIDYGDTVYNFPIFLCRDIDTATLVLKAIMELCKVWCCNNDDRLISYTIVCNYDKEAERFSFAGHVQDFVKLFNKIGIALPSKESLNEWIEKIYKENNGFSVAEMHPKISDILTDTGILHYERTFVPYKYLKNMRVENGCLVTSFSEEKDVLLEMQQNNISISPVFIIKKSRCKKCNKDYILCDCVKFIEDVTEEVEQTQLLGAIWTNRHA